MATSLWWLAFAAWFAAISIVAAIPGNQFGPMPFSLADKVAHFAIFFTGSLLLGIAVRCSTVWSWLVFAIVVFAAIGLIGVLNEYQQLYTRGRSGADPDDMIANAAGALAGIVLLRIIYGLRNRTRTPGTDLAPATADRAA